MTAAASLFEPLRHERLTTLHVRHDWRTGETRAWAARDFEPATDFARYGRDFTHESLLAPSGRRLATDETRALIDEAGAGAARDHLAALLAAGRHEGCDLWLHAGESRRKGARAADIAVINNIHSSVLGIGNGRHAIRAGGIRRHERDEDEAAVFADGLNLARAMSFKNAAARIPYGGSKICVIADPIALEDLEALGFIAWCIDRSRSFTGPDMGMLPEHADVLRHHFTENIVGGPGGCLGPTGAPTARGVFLAMREATAHAFETDAEAGLEGRSVAVQGLGAVGGPLAATLLREGRVGRLLVADPDEARREDLLASLDADDRARVEVVSPDAVLAADVDVVSPNALGGVLDDAAIAALRCRVVWGAANNQLAAGSQAEELRLAAALAERGVLYQIEWLHNAAGVIAGCEEWERRGEASAERVLARLEPVCVGGTRANLTRAAAAGITPTANAYREIEERLYGSGPGL